MNRQTIRFQPNEGVTVALEFQGGVHVQGRYGPQVRFSLTDNRVMYLDPDGAAAVRTLGVQAGEPFRITRRVEPGQKAYWDFERIRASGAILGTGCPDGSNPAIKSKPTKPDPPGLPAVAAIQVAQSHKSTHTESGTLAPPLSGTGTDGPAPQPRPVLASRRATIPLNVAFREILGFVTTELNTRGEQWNDSAKQAAVCTLLIQAGKCGWVSPWERI